MKTPKSLQKKLDSEAPPEIPPLPTPEQVIDSTYI